MHVCFTRVIYKAEYGLIAFLLGHHLAVSDHQYLFPAEVHYMLGTCCWTIK